jgi:hypothetical protein
MSNEPIQVDQMPGQSRQMTPPSSPPGAVLAARASGRELVPVVFGGEGKQILTNLDTSTFEGQALAVNAMQTADKKASEVVGKELLVRAAVCGSADYPEANGEYTTGPAVTLILEDDSTVFVSGKCAARAVAELVLFAGGKEWSPPIRVVIRANKGKMPQPWHSVHVLVSRPKQTGGKGGAK